MISRDSPKLHQKDNAKIPLIRAVIKTCHFLHYHSWIFESTSQWNISSLLQLFLWELLKLSLNVLIVFVELLQISWLTVIRKVAYFCKEFFELHMHSEMAWNILIEIFISLHVVDFPFHFTQAHRDK